MSFSDRQMPSFTNQNLWSFASRTLGRLLNGTLKPDLEAIGVQVDSYRESSVARTRKILITQTDKYADLMSKMSKMSKTAPEPAQDNGSGSGHQLDIKNNTNNLMSNKCPTPEPAQDNGSGSGHQLDIKNNTNNLMSNKCPTPEPAQDKGSGHQLDNMDIMDIKNGYLSVRGADGQLSLLPDELVNKKIPNHYQLEDGDQDEF